jgi:pantetheine-phosphate adenylyltransferase
MRVCVGGTFNILHKGHKLLIRTAVESAGEKGILFIGVSTDFLIEKKKNTKSYEIRKNQIENYLKNIPNKPLVIFKEISDKYGLTLLMDFDAIVVSSETKHNAEVINERRIQINKKPLKIIQIPVLTAEDGKPISSTRIFNEEIDENGRIIK